jgi:hypothetical protein
MILPVLPERDRAVLRVYYFRQRRGLGARARCPAARAFKYA